MLLMCGFDVAAADVPDFLDRAEYALRLLTARPGCLGGELARAFDEPGRWLLSVRFESVVAYRRALSGFEVREHVVPLLSQARVEDPAGYEPLVTAAGGDARRQQSVLTGGTGTVAPDA